VRAQLNLEKIWEHIQKQSNSSHYLGDEIYPALLQQIDQPPPVIYLRGEYCLKMTWR
jgi:predicted Rossmann fold nucleotide-binding protein DprA/Smf involved in DNA uptake